MALSIYYQNVRGLKGKLAVTRDNLLSCNYDIICLTETWLNDSITNAELFGTGFKYFVYRKDRDLAHYEKEDGGGVLIAVKTSLRSIMLDTSDTKAEDLTIRVNVAKDVYLCLTTAYFHKDALPDYFEDFFDRQSKIINDTYLNDKHFIVGDFNKRSIEWTARTNHKYLKPTQFQGGIQEIIIQNMYFCDLYQFNTIRNHQGKLLDLVLTNVDEGSVSVERELNPISLPVDDYHPPLEINICIESLTYVREVPIEKFN